MASLAREGNKESGRRKEQDGTAWRLIPQLNSSANSNYSVVRLVRFFFGQDRFKFDLMISSIELRLGCATPTDLTLRLNILVNFISIEPSAATPQKI